MQPGEGVFASGAPSEVRIDWEARLARLRIQACYLWRHRRLADLDRPQRFTEWVQRRKLTDRDPRLPLHADKVGVKALVADRLGAEWVIPLLWEGRNLPDAPQWPLPFVLKARHGCNQRAFLRRDDDIAPAAWFRLQARSAGWMRRGYGAWLDEWAYRDIPRGLLVEPFVGTGGELPVDYKIYVFGGHAAFVQVHLERERAHRWMLFDTAWKRVSAPTRDADPPPPFSLTAMIEAAECMGRGFDFVRVDFYEVDRRPLFGEMTFYPGSGLDPFDPVELDAVIGAEWLRAYETPHLRSS